MEASSLASSFLPPTADDSVPFSYPSWVLLDKRVYFAHHENASTKKVKASAHLDFEISFCPADPPAVSHFCVHSHKIREEDCTHRVVSSAENLVLLRFAFRTPGTEVNSDLVDFVVCKAGSGGNLSIELVRHCPTGTGHSCHACIVPRDEGNYLVADLSPREGNLGHFDLYVFSSETSEWTHTDLQLPTPADALSQDLPSVLHKVISIGGGVVGWVDLWRGILFCDVLEKKPVIRFTPLPTTAFNLRREGNAQKVRDVTHCNGFISFVEIEHCFRELSIASRSFKMTQHLDTEDTILDKEFFTHDDLSDNLELVPDGWKIRTMYKAISWNFWKKMRTVHVDDISALPELSVLLPQLLNGGATEFTLRNLKNTAFPFFAFYNDNVVYLMSKVQSDDEDSWIVGVDLETKKLEVMKPYCATSDCSSDPTVLPCAFSEYMNATPRPYDELVAASFRKYHALNNHLPMSDNIQVANSAENGVPDNRLPFGGTVPNNVKPQKDTLNVDGCDGSLKGSVYGRYQQPTQLQPPSFPPTVQPMLPSTRSGYIFAQWTVPDINGRMSISVPLIGMKRPFALPLVLPTPPVPLPNICSKTGSSEAPLMTSTAPLMTSMAGGTTDDFNGQKTCCSQPGARAPSEAVLHTRR